MSSASANGRPLLPTEMAPNSTKVSKVDRFAWRLHDEPGELKWIDKALLKCDPSYQREAVERKVIRIAAKWSWMACGVISVALRGKDAYVYDGWHRREAAMRRADITNLPCLAFRVSEVADEADAFLRSNTDRKAVTAVEKFKAKVLTGDETAVIVQRLVESAGYKITRWSGPGHFAAVRALSTNVQRFPEETTRAWPLVVELAQGGPIHQRTLGAILYLERALEKSGTGDSLLRQPWKSRLMRLGPDGVLGAADKAAAFYSSGAGHRIFAMGLAEALNKGMRYRLPFPTSASPE